jgi:hypothetical protein
LLMEKVNAGSLKTFTVGLPYGEFDEAPFARMVAEKRIPCRKVVIVSVPCWWTLYPTSMNLRIRFPLCFLFLK